VKSNPGKFFQPAGCVVSTRLERGKWSHVLSGCTGPRGRFTFNGTVNSTWTLEKGGALDVVHDASDLIVGGKKATALISGARTVAYSRLDATLLKKRAGNWTGLVAKSSDLSKLLPFAHQADFTTTWNSGSKLYTRNGSAQSMIGDRTFKRIVTGYEAVGGPRACPNVGQVVLELADGTREITIDFLGKQDILVTGPRGNAVPRKISCDEAEAN
jgi:hypothetical protein